MIPDFRIIADDKDVTERIRRNLVTLTLTDKDGMEADQVEIVITDPTAAIALPRRGATLRIAIGWKDAPLTEKGSFIVDEVGEEGPPDCIRIVARAADFRAAIKDARDISYHDTSLGQVLAAIAGRNGLEAAIHPDLAGVAVAHLDQTSESDANLVTRLADDYGAVATIKDGRLVFVPRGTGKTASGGTLPAVHIERRDGDRHTFRATDRDGSQTGVQAKWHDHKTGRTMMALAGKEGSVKTLKRVYASQEEAAAAAQSAWGKQASQSHEFTVTLALGRADILACSPLTLSGWRQEITSLPWVTGQVTHTIDGAGGFTTDISATENVKSATSGKKKTADDLDWVDQVPTFAG